jgi:N-hydroxyarylamine O-acetyltransferase
MNIAFENVSVVVDGPPSLELNALEEKLVHNQRGGYCYEHNSLLQAALDDLGFKVKGLSARVRYGLPPGTLTPRSHMILCVEVSGGDYLVDVGFGGLTLTSPVPLNASDEQPTLHESVRLLHTGDDRLLQARLEQQWSDVYQFDLSPQLPPDYAQQNWHTATRPNSLFANNLIATLPTERGRYALFNRTLTFRPLAGHKQVWQIDSIDFMRSVLKETFFIALSDRELDRIWQVSGAQQVLHRGFS